MCVRGRLQANTFHDKLAKISASHLTEEWGNFEIVSSISATALILLRSQSPLAYSNNLTHLHIILTTQGSRAYVLVIGHRL